eukprot:scaffold2886_cov16-Tisochrysis_lutea.AAC.1
MAVCRHNQVRARAHTHTHKHALQCSPARTQLVESALFFLSAAPQANSPTRLTGASGAPILAAATPRAAGGCGGTPCLGGCCFAWPPCPSWFGAALLLTMQALLTAPAASCACSPAGCAVRHCAAAV